MLGAQFTLFDVTIPFREGFPVWPGDPAIEFRPLDRIETGGSSNVTQIVCPTHCGTHVDPPRHFIAGGATMSDVPIERWIGPCSVVELGEGVQPIEPADLITAGVKPGTERLLLKTSNGQIWDRRTDQFETDFAALTLNAAVWLVDQGVRLVGIDYLSIELFDGDGATHRALLGAGVIVIEGLDLRKIEPGPYLLLCLPLKIQDGDGAPARVVLARTT